ncbi:hypothetical protein [Bacillus sp. FJAT-49736]|uniref:hypothetical protein n=1 Tax=Bacillus sp. FJAT-49736 TaxID=2833582 RepID=UPI001BCA5043|nr:hypothetical protein [Bacillus sp. FJAT-49736]MBS4172321.1 hypothetical protein [Bacillus sp. FJAT-49736]
MHKHEQMDIFFLPTKSGVIKIYSYGFSSGDAWGQVFTEFNDITVTVKGYSQKKAIIKSITRLNDSLLNKNRDI